MAAFDPEDVFDLNNPHDRAEFNQLYRGQVRVIVGNRDPSRILGLSFCPRAERSFVQP
jgi:hypothetical protein